MTYQADATDRKIIALLQANGRIPSLEIARQIGVVEGTVRKRLERLLAEGVVKVSAVADHESLGYSTHVVFRVQADLGRVEAIGRQLGERPETVAVWQSTGGCDLVIEAVFPSDRELVLFLQGYLALLPGIGRVETSHLVRTLKRASQWRLPEVVTVEEKASARATIVVVDDDPTFLDATRAVLESQGYSVVGVRNGEDGLATMRRTKPDLAILDVMMSYLLEGLHVSQAMGDEEALRQIPILMVSALPTTEHVGMFPTDEHLRASEFLTKPVAPAALLAAVERVLADSMVNQSG